ncbi:MAG TPA: hypothetical protein VED84_02935 [Acidimicrobiales bacterium]|nr:hypothetical protein [Acidimicrobiales bacterium]
MAKAADDGSSRSRAAFGETVSVLRRYVVQETLAPLRQLGRRLVFGLSGALLIAIGAVIALIGMLRALQTETGRTFAGHWSFAPYLLTAAAAVVALAGFVAFGFRGVVTRGARPRSGSESRKSRR